MFKAAMSLKVNVNYYYVISKIYETKTRKILNTNSV